MRNILDVHRQFFWLKQLDGWEWHLPRLRRPRKEQDESGVRGHKDREAILKNAVWDVNLEMFNSHPNRDCLHKF